MMLPGRRSMVALHPEGHSTLQAASTVCSGSVRWPPSCQQLRSRPRKRLLRLRATAFEAPALQQRQREAQTETGGDGGGGWGWGGGGGGRPPQGGGGGGGQDDQHDEGAADEPVSSLFDRVAMRVQSRLAADPWFWWRLAAGCCVDVLAVLAVNAATRPAERLHRSEFVTSQILVALLNTVAVGFVMEPFSRRVRVQMVTLRLDGGLAAAASPLRWPPYTVGVRQGVLAVARRLVLQGMQLGLVGLLTGCAGSAAARQLERHSRGTSHSGLDGTSGGRIDAATPAAVGHSQQMQLHMDQPGDATSELEGERHAVVQQQQTKRCHADANVLRVAAQRMAMMAVSANLRHAVLYAAEDSLGLYAAGGVRLWTARLLLHGANALLAAAQWQRMSQGLYAA